MKTEEKAQAYDKALEAVKRLREMNPSDEGIQTWVNENFPELKESEDALTWLTKYIEEEAYSLSMDIRDNEDRIKLENLRKSLAWLEKQCEPIDKEKVLIGARKNVAWLEKQGEKPQGKSALESINEEKVDNANRVEPKYKVGVWLVCCDYEPEQIIGIRTNVYEMSNGDLRPFYMIDNNHNIRLWTIREAKDGDVLATKNAVFIFKHIDKTGLSLCKSYCEVIGNSKLGFGFDFSINGIYPATKEQRDLLFQKVKEAGYEWDEEKKELKKIEQKSANNVKPKFKIGDWIVYNRNDSSREILYVYDIRDGRYYFNDNIHFSWSVKECDEKCHLWTIKDAKEDDVLQLGGVTAIFKEYIGNGNCKCYCSVCNGEFEIPSQDGADNSYGCYNATPATKEQRDTLLKAMADAGFTFDFEKKDLKKLEQNPAWSEQERNEDIQQWIDAIIKDLEERYKVNKDHRATIQIEIDILKSLKDKYTKP